MLWNGQLGSAVELLSKSLWRVLDFFLAWIFGMMT